MRSRRVVAVVLSSIIAISVLSTIALASWGTVSTWTTSYYNNTFLYKKYNASATTTTTNCSILIAGWKYPSGDILYGTGAMIFQNGTYAHVTSPETSYYTSCTGKYLAT